MTSTEVRTCADTDCQVTRIVARGMCRRHYNNWLYHNPDEPREFKARTTEQVRTELAEYEFLRSTGHTPLQACRRLDRHPRTIIRWHRRLGLPEPDGLWQAHNIISAERRTVR